MQNEGERVWREGGGRSEQGEGRGTVRKEWEWGQREYKRDGKRGQKKKNEREMEKREKGRKFARNGIGRRGRERK